MKQNFTESNNSKFKTLIIHDSEESSSILGSMSQGPVLLNSEQYQVKNYQKGFNFQNKGLVIVDPHKTMIFGSQIKAEALIEEEEMMGATQLT